MANVLLLVHIIGGLFVLGLSIFGFFAKKQVVELFHLITLLICSTFLLSVVGAVLSMMTASTDLTYYCVRGVLYFTIVSGSLMVMTLRRSPVLAWNHAWTVTGLSFGLYFVPLVASAAGF